MSIPINNCTPSRFSAKVDRETSASAGGMDCWLWIGMRQGRYGAARISGRVYAAHRVAVALDGRQPADNAVVMHRCDNPMCVNPGHLDIGHQADNVRDMIAKGRHRPGRVCGEANQRSILSESAVRAIRSSYSRNRVGYKSLARAHGVSSSAIRSIVKGRTWTSVHDKPVPAQ